MQTCSLAEYRPALFIFRLSNRQQLLLSLRELIHQCIGLISGKSVRELGHGRLSPEFCFLFPPHDSAFKLAIQ